MKKTFFAVVMMGAAGTAAMSPAALFTADFETNQSSTFTQAIGSEANDASSNFTYDSSTHVQVTPSIDIPIGAAPNSTATTKVVRLDANVTEAASITDAISLYPNVTGLGATWHMDFDAWQNYNGDLNGGAGSTNNMIVGATSSKTFAPRTPNSGNVTGTADAFYFAITGEGQATVDYRYYSGAGTVAANFTGGTTALWFGGASGTNQTAVDPVWTNFFTTPNSQTPGAPGKRWLTFKLTVSGTTATLSIKRVGDASFTDVAVASGVPATAVNPFVGFGDINSGQAAPVADQFLLVDNLLVDNGTGQTAAGFWTMYD
ncbi:hypothetical protein BH09SUM1_BH09SUM1_21790 [soil metagenome]